MSEDAQVISDASDLRKYRTELPNLYDDADLDVYEFRLLAHYKRVGQCTEGLETTARKCHMSEGKVSQVRQSLADKGFIQLQRIEMDESRYRFVVIVVDRWMENFARYSGLEEHEIRKQVEAGSPSQCEGSPSPHEGSPSHSEASPSPHEGKNKPFKKEPIKNLTTTTTGGEIFSLYEQNIGQLTPMMAEVLKDAESMYPPGWIGEAIQLSVENNKRAWGYCEAILKRWQANGKDSGGRGGGKAGQRPAPTTGRMSDEERVRKAREAVRNAG